MIGGFNANEGPTIKNNEVICDIKKYSDLLND